MQNETKAKDVQQCTVCYLSCDATAENEIAVVEIVFNLARCRGQLQKALNATTTTTTLISVQLQIRRLLAICEDLECTAMESYVCIDLLKA